MPDIVYVTWEVSETRSVSRQSSLRGGDFEQVHLTQEWVGLVIDKEGRTLMTQCFPTEQEMREKLGRNIDAFRDRFPNGCELIWEDPINPSVGFTAVLRKLK